MSERRTKFGVLMEKTFRTNRASAERMALEAAEHFKGNWESRFGDHTMIWGDQQGGPPEPLSPATIRRRARRGYDSDAMLDDPTLPHVDVEGQIKDSIRMEKLPDNKRGWATDVGYIIATDHPKFPLNEYGIDVPQRMTLEPTKVEVGPRFTKELLNEFMENMMEMPE